MVSPSVSRGGQSEGSTTVHLFCVITLQSESKDNGGSREHSRTFENEPSGSSDKSVLSERLAIS